MDAYTDRSGFTIRVGSFVESLPHGEAGRLIAFEARERKREKKGSPPIWYGRVLFTTGYMAGDIDSVRCELLYLTLSPQQLERSAATIPREPPQPPNESAAQPA